MAWHVIYTKPNSEKKVAQSLEAGGRKVFCPVTTEMRQWSDRKKTILVPLFKSYVFVWVDVFKDEHLSILQVPGVLGFLKWVGKPGIVKNEEIQQIREFVERYGHHKISVAAQYAAGDKVSIAEGPLAGKGGTVVAIRNRTAILELETLGCCLLAHVPVSSIQENIIR
jgi:transcriptional antiterminator RfaH